MDHPITDLGHVCIFREKNHKHTGCEFEPKIWILIEEFHIRCRIIGLVDGMTGRSRSPSHSVCPTENELNIDVASVALELCITPFPTGHIGDRCANIARANRLPTFRKRCYILPQQKIKTVTETVAPIPVWLDVFDGINNHAGKGSGCVSWKIRCEYY